MLLPMIALATAASGATLSVDPGDPSAFATISEAIAAAASGDSIEVAAGSYAECLDPGGEDLSIASLDGAKVTTLDATDLCDDAISVTSGEALSLQGFTVRNDRARGATVYYSELNLEEVVLSDCGWAGQQGGAIYTYGGSLNLQDCALTDNAAAEGGAIYLYAYGSMQADGCSFEGNLAESHGGAIFSYWENQLSLTSCSLKDNSAVTGSGGALVAENYSELNLEDVEITGNSAYGSGGAIFLYATDRTASLTRVTVSQNTSQAGWGGGIECEWWNHLDIVDSSFVDNEACYDGGAIANWYEAQSSIVGTSFEGNRAASGSGGALILYPGDTAGYPIEVSDCSFSDNEASSSGGALWAGWSLDVQLLGSRFTGNEAGGAGGAVEIYVVEDATVAGNLFCANQADYGGALAVEWATTDSWSNNIFLQNEAGLGGGAYRYASYGAQTVNNSFAGNSASEWGGAYYASWAYSDFRNNAVVSTVAGNGIYAGDAYSYANSPVAYNAWSDNVVIDAGGYFWVEQGLDGNLLVEDAGFLDLVLDGSCDDDLHLALGSPLIDAGDPEIPDPDGSPADIGAYGGPETPIEDHDGDGWDRSQDCVDGAASIHPHAEEVCDGHDNDCDGEVDGQSAVDAQTWYPDVDGDGYGEDESAQTACDQPSGYVAEGGDCDDSDAEVNPGAEEIPGDEIDQDCDGEDGELGDTGQEPADSGDRVEEQEEEGEGCGCAGASGAAGAGWVLVLLGVGRRCRATCRPTSS